MNTILHIINSTALISAPESGPFAVLSDKDAVILIENGVYQATSTAENRAIVGDLVADIYVLMPDLLARGLNLQDLMAEVKAVDYEGFVDLTSQFNTSVSW